MEYEGKLYGKVAGEYFPLIETTEDIETLRRSVGRSGEDYLLEIKRKDEYIKILKQTPDNSNTRVIEYLKGKLEETSPYQSGGNYLIAHLKSWIKELEGKSNLQQ